MAENTIPKNAIEWITYISLVSTASRPDLQANPTIAAGDFQVSTDGSAFTNLDSIPVVTPASGVMVKLTLSIAEMTGDNVTVKCIDASGGEWDDLMLSIHPATRKMEDLAWPTTTGRSLDLTAAGEVDVGLWVGAAPNALVTGRMDSRVNSMAASVINASVIATDAIGSAELATSAVEEIRDAITGGTYALDTDANGAIRIVDGTGARELNTNSGAVALVDLVTTTTTNTDMVGTDSAALASVCTEVRLAELAAGNLPTDVANVKSDTAATLTDTAAIGVAGAGLTDLGGMSTGMKAEVNVEVLDVHNTDTIAQLAQGLPPATPTEREVLMWLYQYFRNKREQTSTTVSLYDDAGTTVIAKATVSDDATTFTKEEFVTGP